MTKRRRLGDLYVVGKEVSFDDGEGEPIVVYVRKLNPVDQEVALKRSNAARARAESVKSDPEGDDYQTQWNAVADYQREDLITYLVENERAKRQVIVEAEVAAEPEWDENSRLEGLQDAWRDGLDAVYAADPEDPEASRVFKEMSKYVEQVDHIVAGEMENKRLDLETMDDDALRSLVFDQFISLQGSLAWLNEYRRCEVWLSVYEADKRTPYFEDRDEVNRLSSVVFNRLSETYQDISVDPIEGKDLPVADISSP